MHATQVSANMAAALELVRRGLRVFPCNSKKQPILKGSWKEVASNSTFAVQANWGEHPDALPALHLGAHELLVIDCDRKRGADGVAAFYALCRDRGIDLSQSFVVETPSGGMHVYFRTAVPFGNSRGSLPAGIDVRGAEGYVIAPGATLKDGRAYRHVAGSWDAIPALPDPLAVMLKEKRLSGSQQASERTQRPPATDAERVYAEAALDDEVGRLSAMREGDGRNGALNGAAYSLGTLVGAGWIERDTVAKALWEAVEQNGYRAKDGDTAAWNTLLSGLESGIAKPRDPLPEIEIPQYISDSAASWIEAYKAKHHAASAARRTVTLLQGSEISERRLEWLWQDFLPKGKLTLLAGAGGTGKSTIAFNLAATITNAGLWPDGTRCESAGNVLIFSTEDDAADTIKPRMMAVAANEHRYGIITGTVDEQGASVPFNPGRDMSALRDTVRQIGGVSLLIIDPIVSAISGDMHKANDVRQSLQAVVDFASEMNCAVIGITHFAKGTAGRNSAERVIGSQAFAALARMTLVAAKDEKSERRVFTRAKSNNSVDTGGFNYSIEVIALHRGITTTRIVWGEALQGSSRSILAEVESDPEDETSKLSIAKQFLIQQLSNGPVASKELIEHAREGHNISSVTLRRAQKDLGIVATKAGFSGGWMWSLPLANLTR